MTSDNLSTSAKVPRAKHNKVRTGCRTCKSRRIKCDEGYPACYRCLALGCVCDGYGVWGGGGALHASSSKAIFLHQAPNMNCSTSHNMTTNTRRPLVMMPGPRVSSEEQVYLEWFIHGTAMNAPRIFSSPFWDPMILQATVHEPMVLHALLALSSAHKRKVLDPANRARDGLLPDAQEIFLLKQYGGAIAQMQKHLADESRWTRQNPLLAVIMCALFVLLEYSRGRYDVAYVHLTSGARLTKLLRGKSCNPQFEVKLVHFFARLQDQTHVFRMLKPAAQSETSSQSSISAVSVPRHTDTTKAGQCLDALVETMAQSVEQARQIPESAKESRRMLEYEHTYLMASFKTWLLAYDATMAEKGSQLTSADLLEWHALRRRFSMAMDMADIRVCKAISPLTDDVALRNVEAI